MAYSPRTASVEVETARRKVSWGAIVAGSVVAVAITILLGLFGAGLGFAAIDPATESGPLSGISTGSAIYFVIAQLIALFAGGFVAARLSENLETVKAALHGVTVWAVATVVAVWLGASAAGSVATTAYSAVGNLASAARQAAGAVIPEDVELPDMGSLTSIDLQMQDLPPDVRDALRERDLTLDQVQRELRTSFRDVVSRREQARATDVVTQAAADVIRNPGQAMQEIERAVDRLFGEGGVISDEDRAELETQLQQTLGLSTDEAAAMVDDWAQRAEQAAQSAEDALQQAREQALEAAGAATDALANAAFWASLASLLGLISAAAGAAVGRRDAY